MGGAPRGRSAHQVGQADSMLPEEYEAQPSNTQAHFRVRRDHFLLRAARRTRERDGARRVSPAHVSARRVPFRVWDVWRRERWKREEGEGQEGAEYERYGRRAPTYVRGGHVLPRRRKRVPLAGEDRRYVPVGQRRAVRGTASRP